MYSINDLIFLKSKDVQTKRAIIDSLTNEYERCSSANLQGIIEFTRDGLVDLGRMSTTDVIRYCLFAIYASDIGTVMYKRLRFAFLDDLRQIAEEYCLNFDMIIHLSRKADELLDLFRSEERKCVGR